MNKKYLIIICLIVLLTPAGFIYAENILIQADRQTFDGEKTTFEGNVKVDYEDVSIESPRAIIRNDKEGKPGAATFVDGAHAIKDSGYSRSEVKANIINLSLLKNRIRAEGEAESSVFEEKQPLVHINAGSQIFDIKENIIVASEDVNIKYKEILTNSDKARITINTKGSLDKVELLGNVKIDQKKNIIRADEVFYNPNADEMVASGRASSETILDDGTYVVIYADYQQYDNMTKTLITSGNVKIRYRDYIASGPKATFLPDKETGVPNTIVFLGRSKIQEGQKFVEADRIELTLNPKNFTAEGNVRTRFSQVDSYKDMNKNKQL